MSFLRKLFAPKELVWKPNCDDIGGRYVEGGFWKGDRIDIPHQGWTITLVAERDSESGRYSTSLHAKVDLAPDVMMGLLHNWPGQQLMNLLISMFGLQKVNVPGLSDDGMILANEPSQAEAFFTDQRLRDLIQGQPELMIFIGMASRLAQRGGNKGVHIAVPELVEDLPRLKSLVELSRKVIDTLSDGGFIRTQGSAD